MRALVFLINIARDSHKAATNKIVLFIIHYVCVRVEMKADEIVCVSASFFSARDTRRDATAATLVQKHILVGAPRTSG